MIYVYIYIHDQIGRLFKHIVIYFVYRDIAKKISSY